jgi:hypothetical protein
MAQPNAIQILAAQNFPQIRSRPSLQNSPIPSPHA